MSNVFEGEIIKRLMSYLNKYIILSKYQFGFTENSSTLDDILALNIKVIESLNNNKPRLYIYCICICIAAFFNLLFLLGIISFKYYYIIMSKLK